MSWFKISDNWNRHPKARRAGRDARGLWVAAGIECGAYNTDGLVEKELLADYAALAEVKRPSALAARLVEVKLWHDHETILNCPPCRDDLGLTNHERKSDGDPPIVLRPGDFYFHKWRKYQPPKASKKSPQAKLSHARSMALSKMTDLREAIQERDRNRCRYCDRPVNWLDRSSRHRPTYDHVDPHCYEPDGGNFYDGVVTACQVCNGRKGQRTPEEWVASGGLPLLPVPTARAGSGASSELALGPVEPTPEAQKAGSEPNSSSHVARLGPGSTGARSGASSGTGRAGPVRVGLGRSGPGSGLAGLVRVPPCTDSSGTTPRPDFGVRSAVEGDQQ